ncbi:MAG: hypothetical protein LIP03_02635 [Bacteroidales bacterium]|nr:hypothetical protein [Bacteroidales bacterium]
MDAKVSLFDESDKCAIYSLQFASDNIPEFQKFLEKFEENVEYKPDYEIIINAIVRIFEHRSLERYFRPEGKFKDRLGALPIDGGALRLYCLRLSDSVLIVGNGGVKNCRTYEERDDLRGYVINLQKLDSLLRKFEKSGHIQVSHCKIEGIDNINFEL